MKPQFLLATLLAVLATSRIAAASLAPSVSFAWDEERSFKNYHRYAWVPRPIPPGVDTADYERIRATIDNYLATRGFTKSQTPDFAIAFDAVGAGQGNYEGSYGSGWGSVASLAIDIYDTGTKRPIWNGIERVEISSRLTQPQLGKAVELLLTRFPPSHGCSRNPADEIINDCPDEK